MNKKNNKATRHSWVSILQLVALMVIALQACRSNGPVYQEPPEAKGNDVLVMLFRPDSQSNSDFDSLFYLNEVNVVKLSRNEYTWLHVPEGKYVLKHVWANNPSDAMQTSISLRKGSVYFYTLSTSNLNGNIRWFIAAQRHEDIMSQLQNSNYHASVNVDKLRK